LLIKTQGGSHESSVVSNTRAAFCWLEAALVTVRNQPQWRSKFFHLAMRREWKIAKVAMARKLAVRLYWMCWPRGRAFLVK